MCATVCMNRDGDVGSVSVCVCVCCSVIKNVFNMCPLIAFINELKQI